jgi:hypothetical protein
VLTGGLAAAALSCGLASCGGSAAPKIPGTTPAVGSTAGGLAGSGAKQSGKVAATGPGLSRVQLAAKAGAICTAATAEGRKLAAPADLTTNARAAAAYFDKAVPPLDAETKALQALVPSAAVSGEWEAVLGAQVALDSLADGYRSDSHAGRQMSLADITQLSTVGQTIASAAARLGLRCD